MDLDPSPEIEALRADLRKLIAAEAPKHRARTGIRAAESRSELEELKRWLRRLFELNFVGRDWPVEFGGLGDNNPGFKVMVMDEHERAGIAPPLGFWELPSKALLNHGTCEQQCAFLPHIRAVEWTWCQLFSEPGAGSDLASLRTRAERHGGHYVINGQKVWNTQAQWADRGFMLVRTSAEGPRHAGISVMLIDMRQVGVDVRPIRENTGTWDFNEVFLTDAVVPVCNRIGEEGAGWRIATGTLAQERVNTAAYGTKLRVAMDALLERVRTAGKLRDGQARRLVDLHAACNISNAFGNVIATREVTGRRRNADPAVAKLFFSEVNLEISRLAMELLGEDALLGEDDPRTIEAGRWPDMWLYAPAYTISGGASEIMRNILSERVLDMPRS